jgi:hypothetical protein
MIALSQFIRSIILNILVDHIIYSKIKAKIKLIDRSMRTQIKITKQTE